jgi:hypothetical protein
MCAPTRIIATFVYLISIGLTLAAAFNKAPAAIVLMLIVIQYLALIWYSLSFIPYARGMVMNCLKSCFQV